MLTITPAGWAMSTNNASRAFQFKMTSTSSLSFGTSSETRCELDLLPKPWIGIGVHYDVGSKQPNQTRSYFRPGRFPGYRTGWLESTNHLPKANWKPFACAPSVVALWDTRGGWNRSREDSIWNQSCVRVAVAGSDRCLKNQSKRPNPFDFRSDVGNRYNVRTMENPNLPSPHNNYFHFALSHLPNARSLIESQMPPAVLRELKLDTLEIVPGSFVASDLRDRHTDLLLSVELANPLKTTKRKAVQRALIYTLLEHKSEPEPLTVLQLLAYLVRIWEKLIRDGLPLCPIIPLVVYHGEGRWTVARQMSELIPAPPALAEYQVQFGFPLLDLSQLSDDEIPGEQLLQSALALLKYSRSSQLPKKLQGILELLGSSLGNQPLEVGFMQLEFMLWRSTSKLAPKS